MRVSPESSEASAEPGVDAGDKPSILHIGFELAVLLKAGHAALEILGGVLFMFIDPKTVNSLIRLLARTELADDPTDLAAKLLHHFGSRYTVDAQHFVTFYLVSHGLINLLIAVLLLRGKLWAYPVGIGALLLFIAYQLFRWTSTHSVALILFTAVDAIVIVLTAIEYARAKHRSATSSTLCDRTAHDHLID